MGQAKRRGTFKERRSQAIAKGRIKPDGVKEFAAMLELQSKTSQPQTRVAVVGHRQRSSILMAAILSLGTRRF